MASSGKKMLCKNSTYGCTFATSSEMDMVQHFQNDCMYHRVRCFKCNQKVRSISFERHFMLFCKDSSAPPRQPRRQVPHVGKTEVHKDDVAKTALSEGVCEREQVKCGEPDQHLNNVANNVAKAQALKVKQQGLEVTVKAKGNVIQEVSETGTTMAEKKDKVQEDAASLL